jgi:branched-chain amino acid transport system ATP-binding protein
VGLAERTGSPAGDLPLPAQRRLEIARALCLQPRLLLLDESASGLNEEETDELAEALVALIEERALSAILVEHDIKFVLSLAHHLYVLNFGKVIAEGPPDDVIHRPEVVTAYLGHDPLVASHG